MDSDEEEQARGITIDASNVSMVHEYEGQDYLINMIDTPGHVDFGGDVTRAMRAVDGAVVLVDAVEGTMPQTETVLRQALKEQVRPVLFINKVDRLVNELKVDETEMQIRLGKVIDKVNKLIKGMNEESYNNGWKLDASQGTVAFGSALYNWAVSVPYMKKGGVSFKDVFEKCRAGDMKYLAKNSPLYEVVLDMVVHHLPDPLVAQKRRIPVIWHGDKESKEGNAMIELRRSRPGWPDGHRYFVRPPRGRSCHRPSLFGQPQKGRQPLRHGFRKEREPAPAGRYLHGPEARGGRGDCRGEHRGSHRPPGRDGRFDRHYPHGDGAV